MYGQASLGSGGAGAGVVGFNEDFNQISPDVSPGISTNPLKSAIFGERGVLAA